MQCSLLVRRFLSICALAMLASVAAMAQGVSFSTTTYAGNNLWSMNNGPNGHIRIDLNGDGREDFISENDASWSSGCAGSFAVTLSKGDGSYAAPVCYTLPSGVALYFAVGDFSGWGGEWGMLDVAVTNDLGELFIYRNPNADGALTLLSTINLAGVASGLVTADVNNDGFIDIIYDVSSPAGGQSVHVLLGQLNWNFTTGPVTTFTMHDSAGALAVGNFDGDNKTDLMVTGGASHAEAEILYGDGTGKFIAGPDVGGTTTQYQPVEPDSDGTMDLIGAPFQANPLGTPTYYNYLDLEWGHYNRTLTSQHVPLKSCTASGALPQMADFDGDGIADLIIAEASDCQGGGPYTLNFMKGNGDGTFQPEQVIYSSSDVIWEWQVLRASDSSKPDLTVWKSQDYQRQILNPEELVLVNTTSGNFPSCTPWNYGSTGANGSIPTNTRGINICGPTTYVVPTSPVNLSFAGTTPTPGRDMEIWIDGKKVAENLKNTYSDYSFIQASVPLSNGQHLIDVFSVGWDYTRELRGFQILVGTDTCPIPSPGWGLWICSPLTDRTTVTSPVLVWETGAPSSGATIVRLEVWVDGVKMYTTFGSNTLKTYLNLPAGLHQFTYYMVDSTGLTTSTELSATVQ